MWNNASFPSFNDSGQNGSLDYQNSNNSLFDNDKDVGPPGWQIFLSTFACIFAAISPIINLIVICVICRTKELRTPTNTFIVSIGFGEIIFSIFTLPFTALSLLEQSWLFDEPTCIGVAFMQNLGRVFSTYCLVFVCIDRYIAINRPLKYINIVTYTFSVVSVFIVVVISFIINVILLLRWSDSFKYAHDLFSCTITTSAIDNIENLDDIRDDDGYFENHNKYGKSGLLFNEIVSRYIPICVIIICVLAITRDVKYHHRIFAIVPVPPVNLGDSNENQNSNRNESNQRRSTIGVVADMLPLSRTIGGFNRNTRRALRSFFVMALSYVVFCAPFSISRVSMPTRPKALTSNSMNKAIILVFFWLSMFYCIVNPIIIIAFNKKFKSQLKLTFDRLRRRRREGHFQPRTQEVFTISTGLQSVLDTTLIKRIGQGQSGKLSVTFNPMARR